MLAYRYFKFEGIFQVRSLIVSNPFQNSVFHLENLTSIFVANVNQSFPASSFNSFFHYFQVLPTEKDSWTFKNILLLYFFKNLHRPNVQHICVEIECPALRYIQERLYLDKSHADLLQSCSAQHRCFLKSKLVELHEIYHWSTDDHDEILETRKNHPTRTITSNFHFFTKFTFLNVHCQQTTRWISKLPLNKLYEYTYYTFQERCLLVICKNYE